jgi:sugar/nucleoside kinase (ribokinase family)
MPHTTWHVLPDEQTTTFENIYTGDARRQRVVQTARPIGAGQIPRAWLDSPIVLLAPVFHDVDVGVGSVFPVSCLVGLSCQGWLRQLHGSEVRAGEVDPAAPWLIGDIVFVSEEDVADSEAVRAWLAYVPMVVLTRGPGGFTIFDDTGRHDFDAVPAREVDPTGAGDVFAAAFLVRWRETGGDLVATARFAATAAALSTEGHGYAAVASRERIEAAMAGIARRVS